MIQATRPEAPPGSPLLLGASPLEAVAFWVTAAFTAAAVVGFATFGQNPELLGSVPWAMGIYSVSYTLFSVGQIVLAGAAIALLLVLRTGVQWIPAFVALYIISLGSELAGTNVGLPFGHYDYTAGLGPQWFDDVPLVIPLSWFMMAIPSYYLALKALPNAGPLGHIGLGAVILTGWDLALDPAMSYATVYWLWETTGPYYGMPWINLGGWLFTSLLLMGALVLLRAETWMEALPGPWLVAFYAINVLLPLGMVAAAGLVWSLVVTLAFYGALVLFARRFTNHAAGARTP